MTMLYIIIYNDISISSFVEYWINIMNNISDFGTLLQLCRKSLFYRHNSLEKNIYTFDYKLYNFDHRIISFTSST